MLDVDYKLKKLHLTVPEKLWVYLKENEMFRNLDELVCVLLVNHINKLEDEDNHQNIDDDGE